ncbi:hypothetical protein C9374_009635 [Naegleria lovaniensis]|uniref:Right handed beta helix domain-containing protein n=1 Tax=Naegleria lovaniensis TaxID=51637 RepID=A0AA88H1U8_NAELO|nr:uncharacterized protein C9374_009635 [Naegleria lovaniensis]KAG2393058.1 hypothetical protein C9374_009635 [Naegleria lovaniensis]
MSQNIHHETSHVDHFTLNNNLHTNGNVDEQSLYQLLVQSNDGESDRHPSILRIQLSDQAVLFPSLLFSSQSKYQHVIVCGSCENGEDSSSTHHSHDHDDIPRSIIQIKSPNTEIASLHTNTSSSSVSLRPTLEFRNVQFVSVCDENVTTTTMEHTTTTSTVNTSTNTVPTTTNTSTSSPNKTTTTENSSSSIMTFLNMNLKFHHCHFQGVSLVLKGCTQCTLTHSHLSSCTSACAIHCMDSSHIHISNSILSKHERNAIKCQHDSNVHLEHVQIQDSLGNGIIAQDGSHLKLSHCHVLRNHSFGVLSYHDSTLEISHSIISHQLQSGISLTNTNAHTILSYNQIHSNSENGIMVSGMSNKGQMEFSNNEIVNNEAYGIFIMDGVGIPIHVHHNLIKGNRCGPIKDDTTSDDHPPRMTIESLGKNKSSSKNTNSKNSKSGPEYT